MADAFLIQSSAAGPVLVKDRGAGKQGGRSSDFPRNGILTSSALESPDSDNLRRRMNSICRGTGWWAYFLERRSGLDNSRSRAHIGLPFSLFGRRFLLGSFLFLCRLFLCSLFLCRLFLCSLFLSRLLLRRFLLGGLLLCRFLLRHPSLLSFKKLSSL
jgi:hypothetical protein